jgi:hypothetical protein
MCHGSQRLPADVKVGYQTVTMGGPIAYKSRAAAPTFILPRASHDCVFGPCALLSKQKVM